MTAATWVSMATALATLILLGAVVLDRRRIQRRLDSTEGRITGLQLDRDALVERVTELAAYLNRPASWEVGDTPPARLSAPTPVDRWTPVGPAADTPVPSPQASATNGLAHPVTPSQRLPR